MLAKRLLGLMFVGVMSIGSSYAADIIVKERPPKVIVEKRGVAPGKGYVWISGYHRWDGNRYVWEKGRWDRPPREHARWVAPRWEHRRDGYVFIEGHWS
jgi:WXXGXW repeat (2 copies)